MEIGNRSAQQTAECLSQLLALRVWKRIWQKERVILSIGADNMTALNMIDKFKTSTPDINLIAREIALEFGDSTHRPSRRLHVPGIENKTADALSRRHQPGKKFVLPNILREIKETIAPPRSSIYYITKHQ